jgi:ATP-dependent phosphoenolpyruvate carboxykinase
MVHHPLAYAELLKKKIQKHGADVWRVNTVGPVGLLAWASASALITRALLNAALSGSLVSVEYK